MSQFESLIIGEIAQDTNVDYDGTTVQAIGGAVYYSGFAAANMGHKIAVLPKADTAQVDLKDAFAAAPNITVFPLHSTHSFVTKNVYHTPDRERRTSGAPTEQKKRCIGNPDTPRTCLLLMRIVYLFRRLLTALPASCAA